MLQPIDQNVIQTLKLHYKKRFLYDTVSNKEGNIVDSLKVTNVKDVVYNITFVGENEFTKMLKI